MGESGRPADSDSRRGIALIIVLGFLTLIVLLGVSFAVLMRTERLVASAYAQEVRAKDLAMTGLTRAIEHVDDELRSKQLLAPHPWRALASSAGGGGPANLLSGVAVDHIPPDVRTEAMTKASGAEWITIGDPTGPGDLGRVAYVVVDCSGYLDANYFGRLPRTGNVTPDALDPSLVSEFAGGGMSGFVGQRDGLYGYFENYHELVNFAVAQSSLMDPPVNNFFSYSRAHDSARWDNGQIKARVDIADPGVNWSAVQARLQDCGVPRPAEVTQNLRDYLDADSIPNAGGSIPASAGVQSFLTERVPMVNEIVVSNMVEHTTGGGYTNTLYIAVETWFPFPPGPQAVPSFEVKLTGIEVKEGVSGQSLMMPNPSPTPPAAPPWSPAAYEFKRHEYVFGPYASSDPKEYMALAWIIDIKGIRVEMSGGGLVDLVPDLSGPPNLVSQSAVGRDLTIPGIAQVADPRINWRKDDWKMGGQLTMAEQNLPPPAPTNSIVTVGEWPSTMFVRDAAPSNVYEMGFLSVGDPWRTIALYDEPSRGTSKHPVLDYFRVGPIPTNGTRGLVNLNSKRAEVLAAPFYKAPVKTYPDENGTPTVPWSAAQAFAAPLAARTANGNIFNRSTLGIIGPQFAGVGPGWTDAQKESVIGFTEQLFTVRQNMFVVVVVAQAYSDTRKVTSEQKALAIVWRDPYPRKSSDYDPSGSMPFDYPYVRFMKWLYD
jgi:hypothetical protein